MSFADNLRAIRKERTLSQEALAELLGVSRQAVSKWEQGAGYPEVEKLLLLCGKLRVSLDELLMSETAGERDGAPADTAGTVVITSPHENVIARCSGVLSSGRMRGGKNAPQFALFGKNDSHTSVWGAPTVFLGWYATRERLSREITGIQRAMSAGNASYELKYSAKVERRWLGVRIIDESSAVPSAE